MLDWIALDDLSPAGYSPPDSSQYLYEAAFHLVSAAKDYLSNLTGEDIHSNLSTLVTDCRQFLILEVKEAEEKRVKHSLDARQDKQRRERESYNQWCSDRKKQPLPPLNQKFTDYLKPIVLVAINTGMRRGELFNLEWHDIDLKEKLLTVAGKGAKSGNTRHIPLNEVAFDVLQAWRSQASGYGLVFSNPNTGKRFDNIQTAWESLLRDSTLLYKEGHPLHFRFHDLRHTFASRLVMRGASLYDVKDLLGHVSFETTQKYAHLAPEHKAKVVALLN